MSFTVYRSGHWGSTSILSNASFSYSKSALYVPNFDLYVPTGYRIYGSKNFNESAPFQILENVQAGSTSPPSVYGGPYTLLRDEESNSTTVHLEDLAKTLTFGNVDYLTNTRIAKFYVHKATWSYTSGASFGSWCAHEISEFTVEETIESSSSSGSSGSSASGSSSASSADSSGTNTPGEERTLTAFDSNPKGGPVAYRALVNDSATNTDSVTLPYIAQATDNDPPTVGVSYRATIGSTVSNVVTLAAVSSESSSGSGSGSGSLSESSSSESSSAVSSSEVSSSLVSSSELSSESESASSAVSSSEVSSSESSSEVSSSEEESSSAGSDAAPLVSLECSAAAVSSSAITVYWFGVDTIGELVFPLVDVLRRVRRSGVWSDWSVIGTNSSSIYTDTTPEPNLLYQYAVRRSLGSGSASASDSGSGSGGSGECVITSEPDDAWLTCPVLPEASTSESSGGSASDSGSSGSGSAVAAEILAWSVVKQVGTDGNLLASVSLTDGTGTRTALPADIALMTYKIERNGWCLWENRLLPVPGRTGQPLPVWPWFLEAPVVDLGWTTDTSGYNLAWNPDSLPGGLTTASGSDSSSGSGSETSSENGSASAGQAPDYPAYPSPGWYRITLALTPAQGGKTTEIVWEVQK